jgi:hypothetical protein
VYIHTCVYTYICACIHMYIHIHMKYCYSMKLKQGVTNGIKKFPPCSCDFCSFLFSNFSNKRKCNIIDGKLLEGTCYKGVGNFIAITIFGIDSLASHVSSSQYWLCVDWSNIPIMKCSIGTDFPHQNLQFC